MPPEPLPIDRKDFLKDRKPSSSEPVEIVPARWRDSPTTPSSHYNGHGSPSSCRWGGDFRRPFAGGGGWHITSVESGPPVSVDAANLKELKGGISRETSASPIVLQAARDLKKQFHWDLRLIGSLLSGFVLGAYRLEVLVSAI
ncbi:hypothetical protein L1987_35041 [Smallanthus sonchifolius]|uniref:Uncharacterized protein n=1 Tax=Smallanthus sonchifolius TaxID=185202 RepID=A0ACB9HVH4_9ASTR|nr:hypothetical protein L1987_35041 [Smallanthus sonchifolius]